MPISRLALRSLAQNIIKTCTLDGNVLVVTYSDDSTKLIDLGPWVAAKLKTVQDVLDRCPPAGTVLSTFCRDYDFWQVKANGGGGHYEELAEHHSVVHCGYVYPADGSLVSQHCVGFDLYNTVNDGHDGTREVLIEVNNQSVCGYIPPVVAYDFLTPGTYMIPGVPGISTAAIYLSGGSGGGAGGGKGGHDADNDHGVGGPGGGGGAGGDAYRISTSISFPVGTGLTVVVGAGGVGGAAATQSIYDNSWHTGYPGNPGADGTRTIITSTATGAVLAVSYEGQGGQGGQGGHIDDYEVVAGGTSGGGYPAGGPGGYVLNSDGGAGIDMANPVYDLGTDTFGGCNYATTGAGGAGGASSGRGGAGGQGGGGGDGIGGNGAAGQDGFALIRLNSTTLPGTTGPSFTSGVISSNPGKSVLHCYLRAATSCFVADSLVTMFDGSEKPICDVVIGDRVLGPDGSAVRVEDLYRPILGERALVAFDNLKAMTSAEHSMWAREPQTGREWWATRDMAQWKLEAASGDGPDFDGNLPLDFTGDFSTSIEYGHMDGWRSHTTVKIEASADTQLYHLILDGVQSYFVDGYLVSAMANLNTFDWLNFKMHD